VHVIVDSKTGWVRGVRRVVSPNSDERPAGMELELIVVPGISLPPAEFGNGWIDRFFCNDLPGDTAASTFAESVRPPSAAGHRACAAGGARGALSFHVTSYEAAQGDCKGLSSRASFRAPPPAATLTRNTPARR
jgi:hypothetical protein